MRESRWSGSDKKKKSIAGCGGCNARACTTGKDGLGRSVNDLACGLAIMPMYELLSRAKRPVITGLAGGIPLRPLWGMEELRSLLLTLTPAALGRESIRSRPNCGPSNEYVLAERPTPRASILFLLSTIAFRRKPSN